MSVFLRLIILKNLYFSFQNVFSFLSWWHSGSKQIMMVNSPGWDSDGKQYMSNNSNLSLFASAASMLLTVCLPWQGLFLDQFVCWLDFCPFFNSAHTGCFPASKKQKKPNKQKKQNGKGWMELGAKKLLEIHYLYNLFCRPCSVVTIPKFRLWYHTCRKCLDNGTNTISQQKSKKVVKWKRKGKKQVKIGFLSINSQLNCIYRAL